MNKLTCTSKNTLYTIITLLLLLSVNFTSVSALSDSFTPTTPPSAGVLTCYSGSSVFECVQIDAYTVRFNVIGNPYNNSNLTAQFLVQYPNGPLYVTAHWHHSLWVSPNGIQTNPKGHYGIVGTPDVYVNDGGSGSTCAHNPSQLCGDYALGTWNFLQNAVTDAYGIATIGFQQYATPSTTVFWTPAEAYIIVSSTAYPSTPQPTNTMTYTPTNTPTLTPTVTPQFSAGTLACHAESSIFDCVQIDLYTVRWNVVGNPYNNGNITGQFSVQNPSGLVYVTAHWHYSSWVSADGVQTNPTGKYGILGSTGVYTNDGGVGSVCAHNPSQLCGDYPLGTWDYLQNAVTDANSIATVGFQQFASPPATVFWTPQEAYIIVSSVAYGGVPTSTPTETHTATLTPTMTNTPTKTLTFTPTFTKTSTPTKTFTPTITLTPNSFGSGTCWETGGSWPDYTVTYDVSPSIHSNWVGGIESAAQTWTDISVSHFSLVRQSGSPNVVKKEEPSNPTWIASASPDPGEGPFTTSDVKLNPYKNFDDPNDPPYYVVENVMAHEFGHWLKLKHATDLNADCSDATMYETIGLNGETKKIDLAIYELIAANYQYP